MRSYAFPHRSIKTLERMRKVVIVALAAWASNIFPVKSKTDVPNESHFR
jgi:hypothetical protein